MLPIVAIVGRPNVGKSSLFNRLAGKRHAIESVVAGTTRDQISKVVMLHKYEVLLIDTGGLEIGTGPDGSIEKDVQAQANAAIEGADLVLFVVDVKHDLTADDFHATQILRKSGKSCIFIANKCDNPSSFEQKLLNFYELGLGEPLAVSAFHLNGLDDLKETIEHRLKALKFKPIKKEVKPTEGLRLSFIGRPNVGKSSLINAIFGKEKVIVSEIPGTTRDAIEVPFTYGENPFVLIDTAGMRRRGKIGQGIEKYSVMRSFQAIEDSDVVVLVLDGFEGIRTQDLHVAEFILNQYKGLIIAVNKIDLFDDYEESRQYLQRILRHRMAFVPWAPVIFVSALERRNLLPLLDLAIQIGKERQRTLTPQDLEIWLEEVVAKHTPSGGHGNRQPELMSIRQEGTIPPHFILRAKYPEYFHFSYRRYLENQLRERFGFVGTGIKMEFEEIEQPKGRRSSRADPRYET